MGLDTYVNAFSDSLAVHTREFGWRILGFIPVHRAEGLSSLVGPRLLRARRKEYCPSTVVTTVLDAVCEVGSREVGK